MTHLSEIQLIKETILHYPNYRFLQIGNGIGTTTFSLIPTIRSIQGHFITLDWSKAPEGPNRSYHMKCILDNNDYDDVLEFLDCGSDKFFENYKDKPFDVIFIDGDHRRKQSEKDLKGSLANISCGGTIFMHDIMLHGTTQGKTKKYSCAGVYEDFKKEGWTKTLHNTPHKLGELWSPKDRKNVIGEFKREPINDSEFEWYNKIVRRKKI